jgi:hypothetical protein
MRLRAALSRALFAAFVLVAPPLLYGASVRAALARDVAALAGTESPPREAVVARVAACGPCGVDVLIEALAWPDARARHEPAAHREPGRGRAAARRGARRPR